MNQGIKGYEQFIEAFPSREDGPPKRTWAPAAPACLGGMSPGQDRAVYFSVRTEDGQTQRFLVTRQGAAMLAAGLVRALSPRLDRMIGWWCRRQERTAFHSFRLSGMAKRDGSPILGQSQ